jgi:hypothetical protein
VNDLFYAISAIVLSWWYWAGVGTAGVALILCWALQVSRDRRARAELARREARSFADRMARRSMDALHAKYPRDLPENGDVVDFAELRRQFFGLTEALAPNDDAPSCNDASPKAAPRVTPNVMPQKRADLRSTPVPKTAYTTASPDWHD